MNKISKPPKLTKSQMRVAVAKDALKQIKAEKYLATNMVFLAVRWEREIDSTNKNQAQPFLKATQEQCKVCARGALLLSTIRKFNKATIADLSRWDEDVTEKLFGRQLYLMEAAFEKWDHDYFGKDATKAQEFGSQYLDPTERLVAILKNVVKNNGTFKP